MRVTGVRSRLIRFVWLVVVITAFVPFTVAADEAASTRRTPSIRESAAQFVARDVSARVPAVRARAARQGNTSTGSTAFFKSRPGMIALAVVAAGTGYAIYSAQHDRIHSAGKQ